MDVVNNSYMLGDPRLIDQIVNELKSQGIFDNFRKECIADVDTKPAYQNLRQRVEGTVLTFLKTQKWKPDLNKNYVRELLRKNIYESGFLEIGVERIVDQVVNPKVNTVFLTKVEEVVYQYLGIQKPNGSGGSRAPPENFTRNGSISSSFTNALLPNDLEAISPDSESVEKTLATIANINTISNSASKSADASAVDESDKLDDSTKNEEDESPPFEPIEIANAYMPPDDSSMDSHLSGMSGLISHDSNSCSNNIDETMQQLCSKQSSSESRLSIVTSPDNATETDSKMDISEDSSTTAACRISKNGDLVTTADESSLNFNNFSSYKTNNSSNKGVAVPATPEKKSDSKKEHRRDSERTRHKHDSRKDSTSAEKRSSGSDKKHVSSKEKSSVSNSSSSKEKSKSASVKESNGKTSAETSKSRSSSSSKHKSSTSSSSSKKEPEKTSSAKSSSSKSKESSSSSKSKTNDAVKKTSHQTSSKSSRSKSDRKEKERKENGKRELKDDHYNWKSKKSTTRRSTDRDSNDGHSNVNSSASSLLGTNSQQQTNNIDSGCSTTNSVVSGGGNSDESSTKNRVTIVTDQVTHETREILIAPEPVKLIKPRFASNIFEAKRLMKIRKKMERIQRKMQEQYAAQNLALTESSAVVPALTYAAPIESPPSPPPVSNAVISKESWDALEAKLTAAIVCGRTPDLDADLSEDSSAPHEVSTPKSDPQEAADPQEAQLPAEAENEAEAENAAEAKADLQPEQEQEPEERRESFGSDTAEGVKYLSPNTSPKTERFLQHVASLQREYSASEVSIKSRRSRKPNMKYCSDDFDTEVTFSAEVDDSDKDEDFRITGDSACDEVVRVEVPEKVAVNSVKAETVVGNRRATKRKSVSDSKGILVAKCDSDNNNMKVANSRIEEVTEIPTKQTKLEEEPKEEQQQQAEAEDESQQQPKKSRTTRLSSAEAAAAKIATATPKIAVVNSKNNKIRAPISHLRKSKRLDHNSTPPVHIDSFPMPLSPAESDVSASSLDMRKEATAEIAPQKTAKPAVAAASGRSQRYSSDDLYKPRPTFLGSRRRNAGARNNPINNNTNL